MVILPEHKAVFVSTPKCATNTMYQVLTGAPFNGIRQGPHFHRLDVPPEYESWYTFTVVRNPYARAVSIWWRTVHDTTARRIFRDQAPHDLAEFVRWLSHNPHDAQSRRLSFSQARCHQNMRFDAIIHLENLAAEIHKLPFWPASGATLHHLNVTQNCGNWRRYMTDDVIAAVDEWAPEDCEMYGYARLGAGVPA